MSDIGSPRVACTVYGRAVYERGSGWIELEKCDSEEDAGIAIDYYLDETPYKEFRVIDQDGNITLVQPGKNAEGHL